MSLRAALDKLHEAIGRSARLSLAAVYLRNQCRRVIAKRLSEGRDFRKNGEGLLAGLAAPHVRVFFAVGANVGQWTELLLSFKPPVEKGLLFEPSDSGAAEIRRRMASVRAVELVQAFVGADAGEQVFYEQPSAGEMSSFDLRFSGPAAVRKVVARTTVDLEAAKRGISHIDFLKVDVEGYDWHVLRGASGLLSARAVDVVQFEYNSPWAPAGSTLCAALESLHSFGYETFLVKSDGLHPFDYERYGEFYEYSNFVALAPGAKPRFVRAVGARV